MRRVKYIFVTCFVLITLLPSCASNKSIEQNLTVELLTIPTPTLLSGTLSLPWPQAPEHSALLVKGIGIVGSENDTSPVPIASITKVMTALVVLKDHPMKVNSNGPSITMTAADEGYFGWFLDRGGSVAKVVAGEQISELQLLQALLIPSADNIAQTLAVWDAGSVPAFVVKMNSFAASLGLKNTKYVGPSGYNPGNVSTATDQALLGEYAMESPVVDSIVSLNHIVLPIAGWLPSFNPILGVNGVNGIKSGYTEQAKGCLDFSQNLVIDGHDVEAIGSILGVNGGSSIREAGLQALALTSQLASSLKLVPVIAPSSPIAVVKAPWGKYAYATACSGDGPNFVITYPGDNLSYQFTSTKVDSDTLKKNAKVGTLTLVRNNADQIIELSSSESKTQQFSAEVASFPVELNSPIDPPPGWN